MRKKILPIILFCLSWAISSPAQQPSDEPALLKGKDCESNLTILWNLIYEAENSGDRIFVIARLGRGETSRHLTHRRLYNARTYIATRFKSGKVVFAEGEQTAAEARVEFYLGSKLKAVALMGRGGDLCVCCCEGCGDYYGWGKKDSRQRRR